VDSLRGSRLDGSAGETAEESAPVSPDATLEDDLENRLREVNA
jgi:hypothetical protein